MQSFIWGLPLALLLKSAAAYGDDYVTVTVTNTHTVCPCEASATSTSQWQTWQSSAAATSTSPWQTWTTPASASPTSTTWLGWSAGSGGPQPTGTAAYSFQIYGGDEDQVNYLSTTQDANNANEQDAVLTSDAVQYTLYSDGSLSTGPLFAQAAPSQGGFSELVFSASLISGNSVCKFEFDDCEEDLTVDCGDGLTSFYTAPDSDNDCTLKIYVGAPGSANDEYYTATFKGQNAEDLQEDGQ